MEEDNSGGVRNREFVSNSKKPLTTGIPGTSLTINSRGILATGGRQQQQ
jgi:hypothetical protein